MAMLRISIFAACVSRVWAKCCYCAAEAVEAGSPPLKQIDFPFSCKGWLGGQKCAKIEWLDDKRCNDNTLISDLAQGYMMKCGFTGDHMSKYGFTPLKIEVPLPALEIKDWDSAYEVLKKQPDVSDAAKSKEVLALFGARELVDGFFSSRFDQLAKGLEWPLPENPLEEGAAWPKTQKEREALLKWAEDGDKMFGTMDFVDHCKRARTCEAPVGDGPTCKKAREVLEAEAKQRWVQQFQTALLTDAAVKCFKDSYLTILEKTLHVTHQEEAAQLVAESVFEATRGQIEVSKLEVSEQLLPRAAVAMESLCNNSKLTDCGQEARKEKAIEQVSDAYEALFPSDSNALKSQVINNLKDKLPGTNALLERIYDNWEPRDGCRNTYKNGIDGVFASFIPRQDERVAALKAPMKKLVGLLEKRCTNEEMCTEAAEKLAGKDKKKEKLLELCTSKSTVICEAAAKFTFRESAAQEALAKKWTTEMMNEQTAEVGEVASDEGVQKAFAEKVKRALDVEYEKPMWEKERNDRAQREENLDFLDNNDSRTSRSRRGRRTTTARQLRSLLRLLRRVIRRTLASQ